MSTSRTSTTSVSPLGAPSFHRKTSRPSPPDASPRQLSPHPRYRHNPSHHQNPTGTRVVKHIIATAGKAPPTLVHQIGNREPDPIPNSRPKRGAANHPENRDEQNTHPRNSTKSRARCSERKSLPPRSVRAFHARPTSSIRHPSLNSSVTFRFRCSAGNATSLNMLFAGAFATSNKNIFFDEFVQHCLPVRKHDQHPHAPNLRNNN